MLIRCVKPRSVPLGGLGLVFPKMPSKMGKTAKNGGFLSIIFSQHACVWPSCSLVPSPPAHSRDGLFIGVVFLFYVLNFTFFYVIFNFFSRGK